MDDVLCSRERTRLLSDWRSLLTRGVRLGFCSGRDIVNGSGECEEGGHAERVREQGRETK